MCNYNSGAYAGRYKPKCGHWSHQAERHSGFSSYRKIPVNIEEKENHYELTLFAPYLNKDNFNITTKDDVLNVAYQSTNKEEGNFTRKEYQPDSFERSFILNGKVAVDQIKANYSEGVLKITLQKNPETNKPSQIISVN